MRLTEKGAAAAAADQARRIPGYIVDDNSSSFLWPL